MSCFCQLPYPSFTGVEAKFNPLRGSEKQHKAREYGFLDDNDDAGAPSLHAVFIVAAPVGARSYL